MQAKSLIMSPLRRSPALRATLIGAAVALIVIAALVAGALTQIRAGLTDRGAFLTRQVAALTLSLIHI